MPDPFRTVRDAPLVTVGLPVYNSEQYLPNSLRSLLTQTYEDFVLIISDNASTDRTAEICNDFAAGDKRIQYHRNETNIGNPGNFNRVFNLSSTPYLKWSTADDFWAPTFLEKAMAVMEADESIALCYPKTYVVRGDAPDAEPYEDNLDLSQDDPAERFLTLLDRIELAHQHLGVIRTSMLRRTHLLRPQVGSDIAFLAELSLYGKFHELPERLFYRRFHPQSGSWMRKDAEHQAERYLAVNSKRMRLLHWHRKLALISAAHSAPLSTGAR
ncbi:MAG: glycosyltransferase family 2 protein, partial [Gemmatimonadaceae bacterium]